MNGREEKQICNLVGNLDVDVLPCLESVCSVECLCIKVHVANGSILQLKKALKIGGAAFAATETAVSFRIRNEAMATYDFHEVRDSLVSP